MGTKKTKQKQPDFLVKSAIADLKTIKQDDVVLVDVPDQDVDKTSMNNSNFGSAVLSNEMGSGDDNAPPSGMFDEPASEKTNIVNQTLMVDDQHSKLDERTSVVDPRTRQMQQPVTPAAPPESTAIKKAYDEIKISYGAVNNNADVYNNVPMDPKLKQMSNFKIAQERILELESELERLLKENQNLFFVLETTKNRFDDVSEKLKYTDLAKREAKETFESETRILRETLGYKENEIARLTRKNEELESRLSQDLKKIRVKERELENRLELSKMEKTALVRAKDEAILDLKRKLDTLMLEIDAYKTKIVNLNHKIDNNQDQFGRTVRALRLALTNLESNDTTTINVPLKKAD